MKKSYSSINYIEQVEMHGGIRAAARACDMPYSSFHLRYTDALSAKYNAKSITLKLDQDTNEMRPLFMKVRGVDAIPLSLGDMVEKLNEFPRIKPTHTIPYQSKAKVDKDVLTVYPFTDVHVGLKSWGRITGENWDVHIFKEKYTSAIDQLFAKAPNSEEALIILNGDILHWDGHLSVTPTSQHVLDADTRTTHMMTVARDYFNLVIDKALIKHKIVTVNIVAGNHDKILSYMLGLIIKGYYANNNRVTINIIEAPMSAYFFGKSLILNTHGDIVKYKQAAAYAASRFKEYGEAEYRCLFMGHLHKFQCEDMGGCEVIQLSTLTPDDTHGIGFQRTGKWLSAYWFYRSGGMAGNIRVY